VKRAPLAALACALVGLAVYNVLTTPSPHKAGQVAALGGAEHRDAYRSALACLSKPAGPDGATAVSVLGQARMLPEEYAIQLSGDERTRLLALTGHGDEGVRRTAAIVLLHGGGLDPARIREVLGPRATVLGRESVEHLARCAPPERATLDLLADRAADPDPDVRAAATGGLARVLAVDRTRVCALWEKLASDPVMHVGNAAKARLSACR
jgi:HEAT repeat protein